MSDHDALSGDSAFGRERELRGLHVPVPVDGPSNRRGPHAVRTPEPAPDSPDYNAIFDRVFEEVSRQEGSLATDRSRAPQLMAELLEQPPGRRSLLIRNSRRFQSWTLCQRLIAHSFELGFSDPSKSLEFGELAAEVAERLPRDEVNPRLVEDLKGAAWAQIGNAQRIISDLRKADEAFQIASHCLSRGTGDPLELANLCDLESSLRRAQRRFDESRELLTRAIVLYREMAETQLEGRALIKMAMVSLAQGEPEPAIELLRQAFELIDAALEPRLAYSAQTNLVLCLIESGRFLEAQAALSRAHRLQRQSGNELDLLRLDWLQAAIATGLGQLEMAEELLLRTQREFARYGIGYTAALVSLDLAAIYAKQGRTAEMKQLAQEMLPIFRSRDVHREAMAALLTFREAVQAEQASAALVRHVRDYLAQAQENPRLRFEPPPS
jgi:tetratricopeptide (TPR) repeat protein